MRLRDFKNNMVALIIVCATSPLLVGPGLLFFALGAMLVELDTNMIGPGRLYQLFGGLALGIAFMIPGGIVDRAEGWIAKNMEDGKK